MLLLELKLKTLTFMQMNLLLRIAHPSDNSIKPVGERHYLDPMETLEDMFDWLAVLWQRGLCHDNPQGK
ncbi:hypothetical protein Ccrd_008245 [Cynara cardunculus var. scolymus]|uniref:Uncharacterized protein n=1 Tax=Cynara cardunculus var. scolymus TaxID=59895 RepID=A0A103XFK0_CYNCS|nr:hypothetical protein Ccrd_008245 [Cynara cardunculus var. scolymus]